MQATLSRPEPVEDAAISNLLEIDLREQQDLDIWEEKAAAHAKPKRRAYSFHKPQPPKLAALSKHPPPEPHNTRSDFDRELMRLSHSDSRENPQEWKNNKLMSRSSQLNEGEYWMSKVNWLSEPPKKEHSSQPKLNKRICFGLEAAHRKETRRVRYEDQQMIQEREYKASLAPSLFPGSDRAKINAERTGSRNVELSQPSFPMSPPKRALSRQPKEVDKLNSQVQQYMRETLKRIYQKSKNEESSSQPKPAESERSSMIRELLINLQNMKEHAHAAETPKCAKQNREEGPKLAAIAAKGVEAVINTPQVPQRKFYLNQRNVLNLNLEAEKEYKSRSINQWAVKKPIKN